MKGIITVLGVFLLNTLQAKDWINLYATYGNYSTLIVEGRVIDIEDVSESKSVSNDTNILLNLKENLKYFSNDEKKESAIILVVDTKAYRSKTDNEGYFSFHLTIDGGLKKNQMIQLFTEDSNASQRFDVFIPRDEKHIGIISDFDDTVIHSNVTNKLKLLSNSLLKNFKQREPISNMQKRFQKIIHTNPSKAVTLFFVTGSPHQLQHNIHNFLSHHGFPPRVLLTKKLHGEGADSLFTTIDYKYDKIERLIKLYPHIKWVLLGDSGEKDREVYMKIVKHYPKAIEGLYIRDVKSEEIEKIFPK